MIEIDGIAKRMGVERGSWRWATQGRRLVGVGTSAHMLTIPNTRELESPARPKTRTTQGLSGCCAPRAPRPAGGAVAAT